MVVFKSRHYWCSDLTGQEGGMYKHILPIKDKLLHPNQVLNMREVTAWHCKVIYKYLSKHPYCESFCEFKALDKPDYPCP